MHQDFTRQGLISFFLVALQLNDPARLRAATQAAGKVVLALDGLQPTVGNEVLWVVRDCLSGAILLARSLLSATADDLAPLLTAVKEALDVPIVGSSRMVSRRCATRLRRRCRMCRINSASFPT
jgi:hypothetical protein